MLTKREMELARAALGLPPGFNLAELTSRDVPPELPREVAALLGRARRFTPGGAGAGLQAAHEREVKRFLASNTRAVWDHAAAAGRASRPRLVWGNPYVSVIDRHVVTAPCDACAAGCALVDTRGAEHAPSAELLASNDAAPSLTAESLKTAGAAVLLVDSRDDASAVLTAAHSRGIVDQLAKQAVRAQAKPGTTPPAVRVALVFVADKEFRTEAVAALRHGDTVAKAFLGQMEANVFAKHKATLREAIKAAVLRLTKHLLDDMAAHLCAVGALNNVSFLAVYPRVVLGSLSVAPPASAAEAAELAQSSGLVELARFIAGGDGPGPAARKAAADSAGVLRRGLEALARELELHKQDPEVLGRLVKHAADVAPKPDAVVLLGGGGGASDAPLDLVAWKDECVRIVKALAGIFRPVI